MKNQKKNVKTLSLVFITIIILAGIYVIFNTYKDTGPDDNDNSPISYVTEPFLWRIEGKHSSYIFGSVQLPYKNILTLPSVVYNAINKSDMIYTETKIDGIEIDELYKYYIINTNETLQDLLPDNIENRLRDILSDREQSIEGYSNFDVWVVAQSLNSIDIKNPDFNPLLDQYIWDLAEAMGKELDGLKTPVEQISIFDNLNLTTQIDILEDTISTIEEYDILDKTLAEDIEKAYLEGDLESLNNVTNVGLQDDFIKNRNINMSNCIKNILDKNPNKKFLFTIGARYFYGENGILTLLENKGLTLTKISFNKSDSCDAFNTNINNRCYYPYY